MKEMDSAIIGICDGPMLNSTPKVKKHSPRRQALDAPIDHTQRWKLIKVRWLYSAKLGTPLFNLHPVKRHLMRTIYLS